MEIQPKGFDGNKSYASTVASLKFKIGSVEGNLLLGFYFMAVILFSISSFKDVRVDVMISPTMQPCEEVPERTNYVLRTVLQNFDGRKMFYSVQKEELDEDLKLKHPKVAENYDFSDQQYFFFFRLTSKFQRKFLEQNMASMIIATRLMEKSDCVLETIQNKIFKQVVKNHAAVFVPKPNSVPYRDAWPAGKQQKFNCPVHGLKNELVHMLKDGKDNPPTTSQPCRTSHALHAARAFGSTPSQTVTSRMFSDGSVSGGDERDKARRRRWRWKHSAGGDRRAARRRWSQPRLPLEEV